MAGRDSGTAADPARLGLTEEIKWGKPCYGHEGKNIVILQEMKDFLALMFFKGALLDDPDGVLEEQGPNSRSARRHRVHLRPRRGPAGRHRHGLRRRGHRGRGRGLDVGPAPELDLVEELRDRLDRDPA